MNIKKLKVVEGGRVGEAAFAILTEDSILTRGDYWIEGDKLVLCLLPEKPQVMDIIRINAGLDGAFRLKANDDQEIIFGKLSPSKSVKSRFPFDHIELVAINKKQFVVTLTMGQFVVRSGRPKRSVDNSKKMDLEKQPT